MTENLRHSKESHPLGNFRKSYTPRAVSGKVMLGSAIFCALMGVLEFANAISKYLGPPNTILSDRFRKDAILIAAILGVIFSLLTVTLGALYYTHKKHRVDLYEHGFVVITWRESTSFSWYNIDDYQVLPIYGRSNRPVNLNFTVRRDDGIKAQFRGLENLEALGRIIEAKIS